MYIYIIFYISNLYLIVKSIICFSQFNIFFEGSVYTLSLSLSFSRSFSLSLSVSSFSYVSLYLCLPNKQQQLCHSWNKIPS